MEINWRICEQKTTINGHFELPPSTTTINHHQSSNIIYFLSSGFIAQPPMFAMNCFAVFKLKRRQNISNFLIVAVALCVLKYFSSVSKTAQISKYGSGFSLYKIEKGEILKCVQLECIFTHINTLTHPNRKICAEELNDVIVRQRALHLLQLYRNVHTFLFLLVIIFGRCPTGILLIYFSIYYLHAQNFLTSGLRVWISE